MEYTMVMPLDYQLREKIPFPNQGFPVQYYVDDLMQWSEQTIPLHWHAEHEFFSAVSQDIQVQIGMEKVTLLKGETIFINGNQLHSYKQRKKDSSCLCPNLLFSGEFLAPVTSDIYCRYLQHVLHHSSLPYIILSPKKDWHRQITEALFRIYALLSNYGYEGYYKKNPDDFLQKGGLCSSCFELDVLQEMLGIFRLFYLHRGELPYKNIKKQELRVLLRVQKMLQYIQLHYTEKIMLGDIGAAAGVSRSEADRCFRKYYNCAPMEYVMRYRLEQARVWLSKSELSVKEVGNRCGFQDTSYFIRVFHRHFGETPSAFQSPNAGVFTK